MSKATSKRQKRKSRQRQRVERAADRDMTCRVFSIRAESADVDAKSVDAVFATENPVRVFDFASGGVIEEVLVMDGVQFRDSVPLLDSHHRNSIDDVLGNARNFHLEDEPGGKKRLVGTAFFDDDEKGNRAFRKFLSGSLRDFSIGYRVKHFETVRAGESMKIKGREFQASPQMDLRVTTESEVFEISATPVGADSAATARGDDGIARTEERDMDFEKWLETRNMANASADEKTLLRKVFDAEKAATKAAEEAARAKADAAEAEKKRAAAKKPDGNVIDFEAHAREAANLAVTAERERAIEIRAEAGGDVTAETVERCIAEGMGIDAARKVFLKEIRENRAGPLGMPAIHVKDNTASARALSDGMFLRGGGEIKDEKQAEAADKFRGMSLRALVHEACMLDGAAMHRHTGTEEVVKRAFSSGAFGNIVSNVAHKSLMKGFANQVSIAMQIFNIGNVSDFKAHRRIRMSDAPALDVVGRKDEVTHTEFEDTAEDISAITRGKLFTLARADIIDDDIGALTRIPERMGGAARRTLDDAAFREFMSNPNLADGNAVFVATEHGNLRTGSGSALTPANAISALSDANIDYLKQTDVNGTPLNIQPMFLLVPPELKFNALQAIESTDVRTVLTGTTDSTLTNSLTSNPHQGTLTVVAEPRLSNTNFTGNSATAWYLLGNPSVTDTMEIAFLNGQQQPTLSRHDTLPNILGITWRVIFDFGVAWMDHRSVHKNDGA